MFIFEEKAVATHVCVSALAFSVLIFHIKVLWKSWNSVIKMFIFLNYS